MNVKVNITTDSGSDVDQVSRAVATRLKAYRKAKKMSLDELSRRASISKGMLVEMEKEAANPSIAILCKLAAFASPGHPATTFELLHVEAGALTLTLGETCRTVAAGESAVARTEIEHGYRNEGTAPLVFTMTVAELPS